MRYWPRKKWYKWYVLSRRSEQSCKSKCFNAHWKYNIKQGFLRLNADEVWNKVETSVAQVLCQAALSNFKVWAYGENKLITVTVIKKKAFNSVSLFVTSEAFLSLALRIFVALQAKLYGIMFSFRMFSYLKFNAFKFRNNKCEKERKLLQFSVDCVEFGTPK